MNQSILMAGVCQESSKCACVCVCVCVYIVYMQTYSTDTSTQRHSSSVTSVSMDLCERTTVAPQQSSPVFPMGHRQFIIAPFWTLGNKNVD